MKKLFLLVPVAALVMTACTSESTESVGAGQQPKEIAFSALAQNPTRAASASDMYNAVAGTDYPKNYTMDVVAYTVPTTSADGVAGDYFASTNFTLNHQGGAAGTDNGLWGGTSTARYWPLSPATLNFLAVSNWSATSVVSTAFGSTGANYASKATVTLSDNKPSAYTPTGGSETYVQHDLMYAKGSASVTQASNTLTFPGNVAMEFNHALAWVNFTVKAATTAEQSITINSITLNNAYYSGEFEANQTNYDALTGQAWGTCKWNSAGSQTATVASPNWTATALTTSAQTVGSGLLVVPTSDLTSTVSFDSFTINYTYNGRSYSYTYRPTDAEKTLSMAKKYTFAITFQLHEIFVAATVANWTAFDFDTTAGGQQDKEITIQ